MEPIAVNHLSITRKLFAESHAAVFSRRRQRMLLYCGMVFLAFGLILFQRYRGATDRVLNAVPDPVTGQYSQTVLQNADLEARSEPDFGPAEGEGGLGFFLNQTGLLAGPAAALAAAAAFSAGAAGLLYGDRDVESALVELVSSEGRV